MQRTDKAVDHFTSMLRPCREQLQRIYTQFYESVCFSILVLPVCHGVRAGAADKVLSPEHSACSWSINRTQPNERTQDLRSFFPHNNFSYRHSRKRANLGVCMRNKRLLGMTNDE